MKELKEFTVARLEAIIELSENPTMAALAKIALAAKKAEVVAYITYKGHFLHAADPKVAEHSDPEPLYDAPPLNHAEQDGWVSCSERMPLEPPSEGDEDYKQVEVLVTDGLMVATMECYSACPKCDGGFAPWVEFTSYGPIPPKDVTHWMPLPAAPKPEM